MHNVGRPLFLNRTVVLFYVRCFIVEVVVFVILVTAINQFYAYYSENAPWHVVAVLLTFIAPSGLALAAMKRWVSSARWYHYLLLIVMGFIALLIGVVFSIPPASIRFEFDAAPADNRPLSELTAKQGDNIHISPFTKAA